MGAHFVIVEDVAGRGAMRVHAVATVLRCPRCGHEGATHIAADLADDLIHGPMRLDLACPACRLVFPFPSEPDREATPEDWL